MQSHSWRRDSYHRSAARFAKCEGSQPRLRTPGATGQYADVRVTVVPRAHQEGLDGVPPSQLSLVWSRSIWRAIRLPRTRDNSRYLSREVVDEFPSYAGNSSTTSRLR